MRRRKQKRKKMVLVKEVAVSAAPLSSPPGSSPLSVLHPGVVCNRCKTPIGDGVRYKCLDCANYDLCSACEDAVNSDIQSEQSHFRGTHAFAKLKDSRSVNVERLAHKCSAGVCPPYAPCICALTYRPYDAFAFARTRDDLDDNAEALALVKKMLVRENEFRLSRETVAAYAAAKESREISTITNDLQRRVCAEFLGEAAPFYGNVDDGVLFLRAAVGNFPSHLAELRKCAQYVDFTQHCRRGSLRIGDKLDEAALREITLVNPLNEQETTTMLEQCEKMKASGRPLVIVSSSSS